ncbi:major histocompatibility complex class I-related gene protein-like [Tiliqua scincoides]|uniref:major histocompatibility complex class I-related gene protein-like n=1 Tax=Tiliqua scincoides TaxID=71010 RepID=UPI003463293E
MGRLGWLLGALLLLQGGGCCGFSSTSHSARFFLMEASGPTPGLPQFVAVGYVDGQLFGAYDSNGKRIMPKVPWFSTMEKEEPQIWHMHLRRARHTDLGLRKDLVSVQNLYNQSTGFHTLQYMWGCELSEDGQKRGLAQYAYDGRDFIAFDKETLTWTAASATAQVTKRNWDANLPRSQLYKFDLEETCTGWLRKYLQYGKETLLRKERPVVKVTRKDSHEGLETLLCRAHGFYPKEIDVTWRKDGEVREGDTFRGVVGPNADGTYYTWLSIEIDPKERSHYRCHVEHDGLEKPLDLAVEESASVPGWLIAVGIVSGVLAALLLAVVIVVVLKKCPEKAAYRAALTSDPGSDSSARA